jgi:SAM-dependent methyltransferase
LDFATFALSQLPPPPARVLEVGCGPAGGIVAALVEHGYDARGVDPRAPEGERFRQMTVEGLGEMPFDAVIAERAFHHVHPLDAAVEKLAQMTRLVVLDEFAWNRIDARTQEWYEAQHRLLRASGGDPVGPPNLDEWRAKFTDLIPSDVLLAAFRATFDERLYEERPYLYRWLNGPATEPLEDALLESGAIEPIGFRWVGVRSS